MRRLVVLILAGVLIGGCTGAALPSPTTGPTASPTATPTPTPTATPTPTPTATPVPSPSLTGDLEAWKTFNDYVAVSATAISAKVTAVSEALQKGDAVGLRAAIRAERTAQLVFVDWLDVHPPRACIKQVWTLDRASAADAASSLDYLTKYMTSRSKADGDRFFALAEKSNEEQDRSNAAYDSVSCAP